MKAPCICLGFSEHVPHYIPLAACNKSKRKERGEAVGAREVLRVVDHYLLAALHP